MGTEEFRPTDREEETCDAINRLLSLVAREVVRLLKAAQDEAAPIDPASGASDDTQHEPPP